jgi:hypothetical protein
MKENNIFVGLAFVFFTLLATALLSASSVLAQPTGTVISFNETDFGPTIGPANRTDAGGTFTTLVLDALQQTNRWKAYIGNVTGSLTLDDSSGSTIFSWALDTADISGEVYSSRSDTVSWADIRCAVQGLINTEDTALNMPSTAPYTVNRTFNETTHPQLTIGTTVITTNTCRSTSTYVNDAQQAIGSADFPLILLDDESDLVYTNIINQGTAGYNNDNYDFQLIVPNDPLSTTTYFFYVQLG